MPTPTDNTFVFDGHHYQFDYNPAYGSMPNVEKLVVWDAELDMIGDATIDHNMEQIHVEMVDDHLSCSPNYFQFNDAPFNYEALAKTIVAASY